MATTKKTVDEVKEAPVVDEVKEAPVVNAAEDEWGKNVTIFVPRANNGDSNYIIASVNGRVFKVQRGVNVDVPAPIAEVLQHSFEAQEEAVRFMDSVSN